MIDLVNIFPERVRSNILVIHAITGCETTLFLFDVRKSKVFKKGVMNKDYKDDLFQRFYEPDCRDISELKDVCEKIIMSLYSYCPNCETLDELRVKSFRKQLGKRGLVKKKIDSRRLPPSSSAAYYHILRVYG